MQEGNPRLKLMDLTAPSRNTSIDTMDEKENSVLKFKILEINFLL